MSAIELRGVRATYGDHVALHRIDFEAPQGLLTAAARRP